MTAEASAMVEQAGLVGQTGVVCFGDSDWWYHNHGHMDIQLMRRFARAAPVLYVNSVVIRKLNVGEGAMFFRRVRRKLASISRGLSLSGVDNLLVCSPLTLPIHHLPATRFLNHKLLDLQIRRYLRKTGLVRPLVWVTCPAAAEVAVGLPKTKLVYQRSDRYEAMPGVDADSVLVYDRLLKKHADLVVYVNRSLLAAEKADCRRAVLLDHGVDYELFSAAVRDPAIPEEMKQIRRPILGFYGGIDAHTSNVPFIEQVAKLLNDFSIVLIGSSSVDLTLLKSIQNVHLFDRKPYEQVAHYGKCFDVCFMAWQQNEWISACNPVKLKEYLAMGKPVVSTPFTELEPYRDLVEVAGDPAGFARAVRKALAEDGPKAAANRQQRVSRLTWDAKADEVVRALSDSPPQ